MAVYRNEVKYYISYLDYLRMKEILSKFLKPDINTKSTDGYWIRSLYFDTPDDKEYIEKEMGIEIRKKIRLRIYDVEDKKVKLEIKGKHNDYMLKETACISREEAMRLINGDKSFLLNSNKTTLNRVYYYMSEKYYLPVVIVDYYRDAFFCDFNNIRITFDRDITACSTDLNIFKKELHSYPVFHNAIIVLEVKFNNFLPSWIRAILSSIETTKTAISKYCSSRDCLYNEHLNAANIVIY